MDKNSKILLIGGGVIGAIFVTGIIYKTGFAAHRNATNTMTVNLTASSSVAISVPTDVVGGQPDGTTDPGISWPGEIISLGNVEVQPQREGTIVEWSAKIGQKVVKGQVLGRLSAPPKTPELIKMLAEEAEGYAKMKGDAQATTDFAKKNIQQLYVLRAAIQKNVVSVSATLNDTGGLGKSNIPTSANGALEQLKNVVEVKKNNLRKNIEQMLNRQVQGLSSNVSSPSNFRVASLKFGLGVVDPATARNYEALAFKLNDELKDYSVVPVETAKNYAQAAIKLVNASIVTEDLSLGDLRKMANDDQLSLLGAIQDYEMAKSELAKEDVGYKDRNVELNSRNTEYRLKQLEQEKSYAEQLKEINEKIAMLEREQQMAKVNVGAAGASYGTVARGINEGLTIVATQAGTVSAITKKNGDFVAPGMPVASINTGNDKQRFVRFNIPSNLPIPAIGSTLTIRRPSYEQDIRKIKLIGAGTAVDSGGAIVADAEFVDSVDWPVGISVRVSPPTNLLSNIEIPFSAVWWDDQAQAQVWLVTEENKLRPQQVSLGRTMGDKIEITEGMQQGNRYVIKASPEMVQGMSLADVKVDDGQKPKEDPMAGMHAN